MLIKIPKRYNIEIKQQSNQNHLKYNKKLESLVNKWFFKDDSNCAVVLEFFKWSDKLFHSSEAATEKERRPYWVDVEEHVEERRLREG